MEDLQFAVPTLFGLEGLCANEMRRLGLEQVRRRTAGCCAGGAGTTWPG